MGWISAFAGIDLGFFYSFLGPYLWYNDHPMDSILIFKKKMFSNFNQFSTLFCSLVLFSIFFLLPQPVLADDPKPTIRDAASYSAQYVTQSHPDPITIEAGTSKWVTVTFRNTGNAVWKNDGPRYISAYTMEPRYRDSVFYGADGWHSPSQIGRMAGNIAPGQTGGLGIHLHAPDKVGEYTEEFYLAAENYSWVNGGYFYLKINVVPRTTPTVTSEQTSPEIDTKEEEETGASYQAKRIMQSKRSVEAAGGERIKLILGYQNTGETKWPNFQIHSGVPSSFASVKSAVSFADDTWESSSLLVSNDSTFEQFDVAKKTVYFRTPEKKGEYEAAFYVTVDGQVVDQFIVPVTVTSDAPRNYRPPTFNDSDQKQVSLTTPRLDKEPRIKVGLFKIEEGEAAQFVSYEDDYLIVDGVTGVTLGVLKENRITNFRYDVDEAMYTVDGGGVDIESENYLRIEPKNNEHAIFTLYNYDRYVTWKGPNNFNTYRGAMEFRMGEKTDDVWVINDLLIHDYAKGIGENANSSPIEYLKAQSVAQVTYAYAIMQTDKHGVFDVVATTGDQLYLGYENERIMPRFVEAVNAVRGQMVTYKGEVVITPYYAHSDGRTRGWHEVWGGNLRPWLVSVPAKYDVGRNMFGHGVGMSQIDASLRAKNDGWDYKQILAYYYTDTDVTLMYK